MYVGDFNMLSHYICGVVKYAVIVPKHLFRHLIRYSKCVGRPSKQLNSCWQSLPFEDYALNGL